MRPEIALWIAIDITRRFRFKRRDCRACTMDGVRTRDSTFLARIYIDLGMHARAMRKRHRSVDWMIDDIIDSHVHEYAHAFTPAGVADAAEERWALAFERAGAWARRTNLHIPKRR